MTAEKLEQIDRHIIELLGERMSLLNSESKLPSQEEQIANLAPLLNLVDVPQKVWSQLVSSCIASLEIKSPITAERSRRVTIVGGRGRMGQFFAEQLTAAGHCVEILGKKDWSKAELLLSEAELVLISVPIEHTSAIIERTARYIASTTAVADITSIKTKPVATMLACHSGPVMGLHPMFGPNKNSFAAQKIVVCPGRHNNSFQWFLDFMSSRGGELVFCQPQEHDRLMAIVQAVRHFSQFGFGVFLTAEQVDRERSLSMSSPNYRLEYEALQRFFGQNPSMYVDIMLATEASCQTIERLAENYQYLADLIAKKDRDALIRVFTSTKESFNEAEKSLSSKNKLAQLVSPINT
ncbi:MAG: hypothetical protein RLZZ535_2904 [Cyanobacteriota bacterium]